MTLCLLESPILIGLSQVLRGMTFSSLESSSVVDASGASVSRSQDGVYFHLKHFLYEARVLSEKQIDIRCVKLCQGSYRQVCVKFKDFSRTSQDFPTVMKD